MEKPSLSSQEWPKLSPSPNEESLKKTELKNKKCDECSFVTHKTYNLKNHKKNHMKVPLSSHISYNSLRVGSPNRIMSIRKKNPNSPLAL